MTGAKMKVKPPIKKKPPKNENSSCVLKYELTKSC